jgi:enoyl-CoA hydratase/carnithine racemase
MDMILTCARISAVQAERYGIVSRVVEKGETRRVTAELGAEGAS